MSLRSIILIASIILLASVTSFPQYRYYYIDGHKKKMTVREYKMERRKQAMQHARERDRRDMTLEKYFMKQTEMDEKIKSLQDEISYLKNEKMEMKKQYLQTLDERIKENDADIEKLKKERSEVLASKDKIKETKQQRRGSRIEDKIKASGQQATDLKKMKEQVDSLKTE